MKKIFYTSAELATILQLNTLTIYEYIRSGRLKAVRIGRHYRIKVEDFDVFIKKHEVMVK